MLEIPAAASGALYYVFADADGAAPAQLTIESPNESSVDHNIALEGNGVNEEGAVVKDGGVSEIEVDVEPGEYTFFCSVEGHREGGMEGTAHGGVSRASRSRRSSRSASCAARKKKKQSAKTMISRSSDDHHRARRLLVGERAEPVPAVAAPYTPV